MHRFIEQWRNFWFPESSAYNLAICRIIVIAAQLIFFFPSLGFHIVLLEGGAEFVEPQIFIYIISTLFPADLVFTRESVTMIYWITVVAGLTAIIGLATRVSALIFALGNWFFVSFRFSYAEEHHAEAILCIFLLLLAFSPSGKRLSIDSLLRGLRTSQRHTSSNEVVAYDTAMWPLILIQVLLAYAYFSTGIAKLLYSGFEWMNGYTLQRYMLANAMNFDLPLGVWLAQQHVLCVMLSITTILFEVFFFVILFFRKLSVFFLIGGVLLHVGIYITMSAPFFQHIVLYSVFIDFEYYLSRVRDTQSVPQVHMRSLNMSSS
jgi:uncharacterized membrane protein YphA (DoxX/SURF4 family)